MNEEKITLLEAMEISPAVSAFCEKQEASVRAKFAEIDEICEYNQWKVLDAFQKERVSDQHFETTSGYGYTDIGRDTLERVFARVFHTEDALVRPQIISGTHALAVTVFGLLRPGDEIVFAVGTPYDTMQGVVGIRPEKGNLTEFGVTYKIVPLNEQGLPDIEALKKAIGPKTRVVEIQRSKGYDYRKTLSPREIGEIIKAAKEVKPDVIAMVDNCYGEFVQTIEPTDVGADIAVESADVVLVGSRLSEAVAAIRLSKATLRNIHQNLFWAFIYNIIGIPLAAGIWIPIFGWELNPMFGAAAMSLSSFCVVTNALRLNLFDPHKRGKYKNAPVELPAEAESEKGEDHMVQTVVKVEGMMCPMCEKHVTQAIQTAGIQDLLSVKASHEAGTVELISETPVDYDKVAAAVKEAGYTPKGLAE